MVSVLLQQELKQTHKLQLEVHVVLPDQDPVPPAPKYWPQVEDVERSLAACDALPRTARACWARKRDRRVIKVIKVQRPPMAPIPRSQMDCRGGGDEDSKIL